MTKRNLREMKLNAGVSHQAICTDCTYSGPIRDTSGEAGDDALSHVSKPGNANHVVTISTIVIKTKKFKNK